MKEGLFAGIMLFGAVQALFFVLLLFLKKGKKTADSLLASWLIVLVIHILLVVATLLTEIETFPITTAGLSLTLLHGPFLFLYVRQLAEGRRKFNAGALLHFLPFVLLLSAGISLNTGTGEKLITLITAISGIISGLVYCLFTFKKLLHHRRSLKHTFSSTDRINLNWLLHLTFGILTIWLMASVLVILVRFLDFNISLEIFFLTIPFFISYLGIYGVRQQVIYPSPVFRSAGYSPPIPSPIGEDVYRKSGLTNDKMKVIFERLCRTVETERLFCEPSLSLSELSGKLGIPAHHITQSLNQYAGISFYDFVNAYRIEEFKKRIQAGEKNRFSILGIAFDCGFSSKSSFNRVFKNLTCQSPSEFIKSISGSNVTN